MNKMIPANRDSSVMIREDAKYCIHVRLLKTNYDPNNPRNQSMRSFIQVFTVQEFEKNEAQKYAKQAFNWVTVSGFDEAYIVHDGRLVAKEEKPEETKEEKIVADAIKAVVKEAVKKERRKTNVRKALDTAK